MKAMEKDWYQKNWTLDIQNMSWVEDTNRQVDFLIKQLHLKGTEKILDLASYGMQEKRDLHYLLLNWRRIEKR